LIDLLTIIKSKLNTLVASAVTGVTGIVVYNEEAPAVAKYPFLVFSPSSTTLQNDTSEDVLLDIDIWDNEKDTTNIEKLNKQIYTGLDHYTYTATAVGISFYCTSRLRIPVPDESLRRRQLRFVVKTFWK
jgi:hypothetical protein